MAAAEGNKYSSKSNRLWGETLRRIAVQDPQKLRAIAEALYNKAAEGDIQAAKEIGDRLDGKSPATLDVTHHEGESLNEAQARNMAQEFLARASRTESVG